VVLLAVVIWDSQLGPASLAEDGTDGTGPTPHTAAAVAGAAVAARAFVFCRFQVGAVPLVVALLRFLPLFSVLTTSAVVF
jgi:hypothetical protein